VWRACTDYGNEGKAGEQAESCRDVEEGIGGMDGGTRYPGGKGGAGVYQTIINQMPVHATYIEPFVGGGAIMALKRPAQWNIGIDLDAEAVRQARTRIVSANDTRSALVSADDAAVSRGLTMPPGTVGSGESRRWYFWVDDGLEFLRSYSFCGSELVYADPPYLLSTRVSGRMYRHEFTESQHRALLEVLVTLPCPVMVSGYWSQAYAEHLQGWRSVQYEAMTRGGFTATEWLWMNFLEPSELHEYSYLGEDFRARERLKRLTKRWMQRLEQMPGVQRQALQRVLAQVEGQAVIAGADAAWYRALGANFRERERVKRLIERWVTRLAGKPAMERQALQVALTRVDVLGRHRQD
jgi:hypothetical protein